MQCPKTSQHARKSILRDNFEDLQKIKLGAFIVLLLLAGASKAQELFYPLWVRFPQEAIDGQLSAAACDTVRNMDISAAKERAFESVRSQIETFIRGNTPDSSDLSIPGIAIKEVADVEDGSNRVICVLAAINTQVLKQELARASISSDAGALTREFESYVSDLLDSEWKGAPYPSPSTAGEYYANAKSLSDNNEILRSLKAYEKHFSFGPTYLEVYDEHYGVLRNHFDEQDIPAYYRKLIDLYPEEPLLRYMSLTSKRNLTQENRESELAHLDSISLELALLLKRHPDFLPGYYLMMSIVLAEQRPSLAGAATLNQLRLADVSSDVLRPALEAGQHMSLFFSRTNREEFEARFQDLDDANSEIAWSRFWALNHAESDLEALPLEANAFAEPIAIRCSETFGIGPPTPVADVLTVTPASRIYYSWDGKKFIDTGEQQPTCNSEVQCSENRLESFQFERSGHHSWEQLVRGTGEPVPRPIQTLPLCGSSGNDVWVAYVEGSSGNTIGPHKITVPAANPADVSLYCLRIGCFPFEIRTLRSND